MIGLTPYTPTGHTGWSNNSIILKRNGARVGGGMGGGG
jgi:hypothetical protein